MTVGDTGVDRTSLASEDAGTVSMGGGGGLVLARASFVAGSAAFAGIAVASEMLAMAA